MSIHFKSEVIRRFFETGKLPIPGVGYLEIISNPASVDKINARIYPPSKEILFSPDSTVIQSDLDKILQEKIDDNSNLNLSELFTTNFHNILDATNAYTLDNVGEFSKSEEGKITFIPQNAYVNSEFFGLPELNAHTIFSDSFVDNKTIKEDEIIEETAGVLNEAVPDSEPIISNRSSSSSFSSERLLLGLIAISIIAMATFIFYYSLKDNNANQTMKITPVKNDHVNTKPDPTEKVINTVESVDNSDDNDIEEENLILVDDASVSQEIPSTDINNTISTKDKTSAIVIVGAFSINSNAHNLEARIESKGYKTYMDTNNGLARVGVKIAYSSTKDLQNQLNNIRLLFNKGAWILN